MPFFFYSPNAYVCVLLYKWHCEDYHREWLFHTISIFFHTPYAVIGNRTHFKELHLAESSSNWATEANYCFELFLATSYKSEKIITA